MNTQLSTGIKMLGLEITVQDQQRLLDYLVLMQKWNKSFNLTAITELRQMISHHVLDSLSIANDLKGSRVLDMGTGAGLPGVPLAIAFPDKTFVLLDSNGKKIRFLQQVVGLLKIPNIELVHVRAENYRPGSCFDSIIIRAVGTVAELVRQTQHLVCRDGKWLLMKGTYPENELSELILPFESKILHVPGIEAERHLVIVKN